MRRHPLLLYRITVSLTGEASAGGWAKFRFAQTIIILRRPCDIVQSLSF